jgi:hypothetical protein
MGTRHVVNTSFVAGRWPSKPQMSGGQAPRAAITQFNARQVGILLTGAPVPTTPVVMQAMLVLA